MARCRYEIRFLGEEWKCPLDALLGEEYCYWHREEDGKEPTEEQFGVLKEKEVKGVYLRKAELFGKNLQGVWLYGAYLPGAELSEADIRGADLSVADLQGADLSRANLRGAKLSEADIRGANLYEADLRGAELFDVNLRGTDLSRANLQGAKLSCADLQGAKLYKADLRGAGLSRANLQGADLYSAKFDSKTDLDGSVLVGANLYHSYFDETKSFRNVERVFQSDGNREINEITGDALGSWLIWILENGDKCPTMRISKIMFFVVTKILITKLYHLPLKPAVIDMDMIERKAPSIAAKFRWDGLIRYAIGGNGVRCVMGGEKIIFFDWQSGCTIKNPEDELRHKERLIRVEELTDLLLKDNRAQSEFFYHASRASLYEASYEVYNNRYNFYIANGRLDQAARAHYRRSEAHRKHRLARGGLKNRARSIFDLLILRTLTGYGDKISRPITVSGLIIGLFAFLFWFSDGIVKNVNNTQVAPDWIDYLYHSITTFTSLGYSNIQPNLAAGHLPQILVAAESGLGVMMMALIIFVVTYQVSR